MAEEILRELMPVTGLRKWRVWCRRDLTHQHGSGRHEDRLRLRADSRGLRRVGIPVIASGGVGNLEHIYDGLTQGKASAALAASIFHYQEYSIAECKNYLHSRGIPVRLMLSTSSSSLALNLDAARLSPKVRRSEHHSFSRRIKKRQLDHGCADGLSSIFHSDFKIDPGSGFHVFLSDCG